MISYFQAIVFGLVQGITELFPISSLGHSVVIPSLLHWQINQKDPSFLPFLVATHTATAGVLFGYFFADWKRIIRGIITSLRNREIKGTDEKLGWLLIIGTIPAGILGILFEESLKNLFASPKFVSCTLIANGILLLCAEVYKKKKSNKTVPLAQSDQRIAKLSWNKTIGIGLMQSIALLPGFSRTGATLTGGLITGLTHEDAARFSFLLATPIIAAASLLKLPEFVTGSVNVIGPAIVGSIAAGGAAFISVKFLVRYFQTNNLIPFGIYCIVFGLVSSGIFLFTH